MNILKILLLLLISGTSAGLSLAADSEAGAQKAVVCNGCHGTKGKSGNPQRPNLAAQQVDYFISQLNAFKNGSRANPMMQAMAINLKEEDIENLAAYYASLPPVSSGGEQTLAEEGLTRASLCLGCHGAKGEGNGEIPRLAGQHPEYLERQLHYFKTGSRKNAQMQVMVQTLSDIEIKELSAYFGSL
jgi:cytochrome c553